MGLWDRWTGASERSLNSVSELDTGDLLRFKLYAPGLLAGATFTVEGINTYEYESGKEFEFVLKGVSSRQVFLTVDPGDDSDRLRLSVRLNRAEVTRIFDPEIFSAVFDQEDGQVVVPCNGSELPEDLEDWTADRYTRTAFAIPAYFFKGDFRGKELPEDGGEALDYYSLISDDESRALEIEIFDGDEDVLLTLIAEPALVEELWPGGRDR